MSEEFSESFSDKPRESLGKKYVVIEGRKIEVELVCNNGAYGRTLIRPICRFTKRNTLLQNLKIENKRLVEENIKLKEKIK